MRGFSQGLPRYRPAARLKQIYESRKRNLGIRTVTGYDGRAALLPDLRFHVLSQWMFEIDDSQGSRRFKRALTLPSTTKQRTAEE